MHGVRSAAPDKETRAALEAEPLYEAERLRIIYQLITNPTYEGGAGITPKEGEWANVESIFALHDHAYNKDWIKKWTSSYFLKTEDLDDIRNRLGEKVCSSIYVLWLLELTMLDCILLCVHSILLHILDPRSRFRCLCMALLWPFLTHIWLVQRTLVHSLHGILETPRGRSECPLGRQGRYKNRHQEKKLST